MYQSLQPLIRSCYMVDRMSVGLLTATVENLSNIAIN